VSTDPAFRATQLALSLVACAAASDEDGWNAIVRGLSDDDLDFDLGTLMFAICEVGLQLHASWCAHTAGSGVPPINAQEWLRKRLVEFEIRRGTVAG
jgi:hypothetical protein